MAKHGPATYPADHKPGMKVPKGGSSCATCKWLRPGLECANTYFQKWNGGKKIPTTSADSYCSDYYEQGTPPKQTAGDMLREQTDKK